MLLMDQMQKAFHWGMSIGDTIKKKLIYNHIIYLGGFLIEDNEGWIVICEHCGTKTRHTSENEVRIVKEFIIETGVKCPNCNKFCEIYEEDVD